MVIGDWSEWSSSSLLSHITHHTLHSALTIPHSPLSLPVGRSDLFGLNVFDQKSFSIYRGHTAGSGGSHRLAIVGILRIAACEDAGDVRLHSTAFGFQIANIVHIENTFEQISVRLMTDRDKYTLRWKRRRLLSLIVIKRH